jgi:hypothetical protein
MLACLIIPGADEQRHESNPAFQHQDTGAMAPFRSTGPQREGRCLFAELDTERAQQQVGEHLEQRSSQVMLQPRAGVSCMSPDN